ncbi:MAG: MFS transporter [Gammaproteobacteria bacterium]|nr:MFS transporter [Gammaproteobacteria bacterium]
MKNKSTKLTLLLASTLTVMSGATISPALPSIQAHFTSSENAETLTKLILTIPALSIVISAYFMGLISRYLNKKNLLLLGVIIYAIAGSSGLYLNSLNSLLISRAILGVAVAAIMTMATTLIADLFEGEERTQTLAFQATFMTTGGIVFILLGGVFADISWRAPFSIYLLAAFLIPLVYRFIPVPDSVSTGSRKLLMSGDLWRVVAPIYAIGITMSISFYIVPTQLPFYLVRDFNLNGAMAGLAVATTTLFASISSLTYKRLRNHFNEGAVCVIGLSLMGAGLFLIGISDILAILFIGLAFSGIALGLLMPTLNELVVSASDVNNRTEAVGGMTSAIFLGQFLSPVVSEPVKNITSYGSSFILFGFILFSMALYRKSKNRVVAAED